jgi:hypothetical protein
LAFSYWTDKTRFLTEEKFATVLIIPSSWGSQLGGHPARIKLIFWRRCRGPKKNNLPHQLGAIRDVVVGFAIFHIVLFQKRKKKKKKRKKGTPPWYVNVGGHTMESVSHGL